LALWLCCVGDTKLLAPLARNSALQQVGAIFTHPTIFGEIDAFLNVVSAVNWGSEIYAFLLRYAILCLLPSIIESTRRLRSGLSGIYRQDVCRVGLYDYLSNLLCQKRRSRKMRGYDPDERGSF